MLSAATIELMEAPAEKISSPATYNLIRYEFLTKKRLQLLLKNDIPEFTITYKPD